MWRLHGLPKRVIECSEISSRSGFAVVRDKSSHARGENPWATSLLHYALTCPRWMRAFLRWIRGNISWWIRTCETTRMFPRWICIKAYANTTVRISIETIPRVKTYGRGDKMVGFETPIREGKAGSDIIGSESRDQAAKSTAMFVLSTSSYNPTWNRSLNFMLRILLEVLKGVFVFRTFRGGYFQSIMSNIKKNFFCFCKI